MPSTLSPRAAAIDLMPHGSPIPLSVDRVIVRKHRADVLRALSKSASGLTHHQIQYDIVRGSVASTIVQEFSQLGLVEWRDDLYFITAKGKEALSFYERLRGLGSPLTGDIGGG